MTDKRRIFSGAPHEPLVAYARAVVSGDFIFVAGTTGRDPVSGILPEGAEAQCINALAIIGTALSEAGASFADVVRVTYYLPDRREFEVCWPHLRAAFGAAPPAATMIEAGLVDPAMRIEIEVTAHRA
ncbi:RidA family protein [Glacieibacterium frigidum]|uniref:RidA family protein n=1 Tax=Glacieibacterium frigidum TaxID=2593303 RepID=A0A552UF69_9SPHN|nr:RidA family protein [Glacieibacterium frigidum]TRW16877.1 RidA family protein [Glacieibacterium frigidum]